jgi:hypothetical protein
MQTIQKGYLGLKLLVMLNVDRVFVLTALGGALFLAAYIGSH